MGWELFRRDAADGFAMVGVDTDLVAVAPVSSLPVAVEVSVTAPSTHPDLLVGTEAAIESLTGRLGGRIAGTVRSETDLWTLVYLPTDEAAHLYSQIPLPARASISVQPTVDPDWTVVERLRPDGIEQQSMDDLAVMARLHGAGDVGGVRPIEHVVTGLDPDRIDAFVRAARSVLVESTADVEVGRVTIRHGADPVDITPDAWTIRQIAERHGGHYDGWTCDVLAPTVTGRATRKRWFRR